MKKIILVLILFVFYNVSIAQVKIYTLDFDGQGSYTTSQPESINGSAYFSKISASDFSTISKNYNCNATSTFFGLAGSKNITPPVIETDPNFLELFIDDIDLQGYTNLEFRVSLAESDNSQEDWDYWGNVKDDFVKFIYCVDNAGNFENLIWIGPSTNSTNVAPSLDEDFDGIGEGTIPITEDFEQHSKAFTVVDGSSTIDLKIVFHLDSNDEDIAIDNIEIWGEPNTKTTDTYWGWPNANAWSNGAPTKNHRARMWQNYDTAINGTFIANSLLIEKATTFTISDGTYLEIENGVHVNNSSTIIIEPTGSLVQKSENATSTKGSSGSMQVQKTTSPMDAHYEFTYWGAPVSGTQTMGEFNPDHNRLFVYNGANFIDNCEENNNNNVCATTGPDDIDDDGNDWQQVAGSSNYEAGVGFISSMYKSAFDAAPGSAPKQFTYTFDGTFNSGEITVPIYRNDTETADKNFNLVGNPYPSAIDAKQFISVNTNPPYSAIDGAIYIWSQHTPPAANVNGNAIFNFSDDYITINLAGVTSNNGAGIDPVEQNGYIAIPSGQGFFVTMSNDACANNTMGGNVYDSEIVFNNSMRIADADANSKFFKNTNAKNTTKDNKIWINLTNDYGGFNQILVAYLNGATDGDDGLIYDVNKYPKKQCSLYSLIPGVDKKFTIQAKAKNSLTASEIIQLGFQSGEDVALNYKITLDHTQGDFFATNPIYLKDNITGTYHDLASGTYTFTSAKGEFNDRFEIVFQNTLSVEELNAEKDLQIITQENNNVTFKATKNIKAIAIYNLLGQQLYQLEGFRKEETYFLPNLSPVYIAKVQLYSGELLTKKGITK